jgi:tetratricopeptide (TPR) repeat protein
LPAPPFSDSLPPGTGAPPSSQGQTQEDIAHLRQVLSRHPEDVPVRIRLAAALDMRGETSEAEDTLRAALQRGLKTPEVYHALGMLYLRNKIYGGAEEAFRLETKLNPRDFQAHLHLAQVYVNLNRPDAALRAFETARKLDPEVADTYLGLAFLNNTSERYQFAVNYLNEYLRRSAPPGPGYALLSRVYINMRQFERAAGAGRKAVQAMPDSASAWYNLGLACTYLPGSAAQAEALQAFKHASALVPGWPSAYFEQGKIYERRGQTADALAMYRAAIRCAPGQGAFHYRLGRLLMQRGPSAEGAREVELAQRLVPLNQRVTQLEDKRRLSPREPRFLYELGLTYKEMGAYPNAAIYLEAALALDPNYPNARQTLTEVRRLAASNR